MYMSLYFKNGGGEVNEGEISRQKWYASFRHGLLRYRGCLSFTKIGAQGKVQVCQEEVWSSLMDTSNIRSLQDIQVEVVQ